MSPNLFAIAATNSCHKTSTAGSVISLIIVVGILGAIIALAVANARAKARLATATAELNYLRPENARLQQWLSSALPGPTPHDGEVSPHNAHSSASPQWYPDPSGRHEHRLWDGTNWTDDVSDRGVASKDAPI